MKKFGAIMAQNYLLNYVYNFVSSYYFREISDASVLLRAQHSLKNQPISNSNALCQASL